MVKRRGKFAVVDSWNRAGSGYSAGRVVSIESGVRQLRGYLARDDGKRFFAILMRDNELEIGSGVLLRDGDHVIVLRGQAASLNANPAATQELDVSSDPDWMLWLEDHTGKKFGAVELEALALDTKGCVAEANGLKRRGRPKGETPPPPPAERLRKSLADLEARGGRRVTVRLEGAAATTVDRYMTEHSVDQTTAINHLLIKANIHR